MAKKNAFEFQKYISNIFSKGNNESSLKLSQSYEYWWSSSDNLPFCVLHRPMCAFLKTGMDMFACQIESERMRFYND